MKSYVYLEDHGAYQIREHVETPHQAEEAVARMADRGQVPRLPDVGDMIAIGSNVFEVQGAPGPHYESIASGPAAEGMVSSWVDHEFGGFR